MSAHRRSDGTKHLSATASLRYISLLYCLVVVVSSNIYKMATHVYEHLLVRINLKINHCLIILYSIH